MSAGKYNIKIDQGSDFSVQLTVKESGAAKDLTGYTPRAKMRTSLSAAATSGTFTCRVSSPASNGILTMGMPHSTTKNLTPGNYVYDLEIFTGVEGSESAVQRLIEGTATVKAEVTK